MTAAGSDLFQKWFRALSKDLIKIILIVA